jgi:hypothetical protein
MLVALLAFDLALFACEHGHTEEEAPSRRAAQTSLVGGALKSAATVCGAVVLALGVLTMGCPLTARDVPLPLAWLGYCLPLQSVFGAMMENQVGSGLPDGEGLLKKIGFLPQAHLLLAFAVPLIYLAAAVHLFLLQFPEPESGPASRLQGHLLDSCLHALERAVAWCGRIAKPAAPRDASAQQSKPPPQRRGDADAA